MKKRQKIICSLLFPILILGVLNILQINYIPKTIKVKENAKIESTCIKTFNDNYIRNSSILNEYDKNYSNLSLNNSLKDEKLESSSEIKIYPGGQPLGIKINTKGVLVVGLSNIKTYEGMRNSPGSSAGIEIGDSILKVNNKTINSAEDVSRIINEHNDEVLNLTIERNNKIIEKEIKPIKSTSDDKYKIGLWIRDCTAGIGTLTYYNPKTNQFAALGHGITDMDTGIIMSIKDGEIVSSNILSVKKGVKGDPGELRGIFVNEDKRLGIIEKNTECGISGITNNELCNRSFMKPMKVALKNEIQLGKAQILTTIDGTEPKLYDIEIEKLINQDKPNSKSMVIRITDEELLKKTGGIVQGMSGSPIIQDGKIIGAVTHVLVNKPDVGYGIYIEWMLKDAGIL